MSKTIIISFGCPRSGTTFLARCLSSLKDVLVVHLPDGAKLHPSKSKEGLIQLDALFWKHRMIFVRIVRSPLGIVDSFLALRELEPDAARARDSDQRIVKWIVNEHVNTMEQRKTLGVRQPNWARHHVVEVRYETLAHADGQKAFTEELVALLPARAVNRGRLMRELRTFGTKPANLGRLKAGISGSSMSPEQRAFFEKELATVMGEDDEERVW